MKYLLAIGAALTLSVACSAARADAASFRVLYKSLVETDTTFATGSCTAAAQKMQDAMAASGFPAADLHSYAVADHSKEGGLVAILRGSDPKAKALLLVAHVDVVDVTRADWKRDPFTLTEEDGYFYGRGVTDDKAMAASLIDLLIRLRQEDFHPRGAIKVALTCGEETATAFNGAQYLATERHDLIDAGLALVPSGGGVLDAKGQKISLTIQAGEKVQQNFRFEATGIGTHASRPTKDNAIYILADALLKLSKLQFPVGLNGATRLYFDRVAQDAAPADAAAIKALLADPSDVAAQAVVTANPAWNVMLRTTCVATIVETGAQANTVAPHAHANINCRLLPGTPIAEVQTALEAAVASPAVTITATPPVSPTPASPPITPQVLAPIEAVTKEMWPGVTIIPTMLTGATDARHINAGGIPAYGLTTIFNDPDGDGVHAPNERVPVKSVMEGREFIYRLTKLYSGG